ncbi:unnamed protein product [Schistosoma mattheei]|uniref:Uncharacterized protein n=1 Tax=Schistosoma mattheei TaxID=31246 RepID=A0A183NPG0_9TREM|nr:unnamed protein product [Schistosoma mattheei]
MGRPLTTDTIDLTPFPELYTKENIILHKIFNKYGFELRIAGGAVRDILLGISPHDIDFATNATPPQMCEMFSKEGIRMLNRNGESHGTVTARINDKVYLSFSAWTSLSLIPITIYVYY